MYILSVHFIEHIFLHGGDSALFIAVYISIYIFLLEENSVYSVYRNYISVFF